MTESHDGFPGLVERQLEKARRKHPSPLHSPHEGYAVLLEEVYEFFDCVRAQQHDPIDMLNELSQIGAMAQRIAEDVIEPMFPGHGGVT